MILSAASGVRGLLVDLTTGKLIRRARWANTETGEYEAERIGPDDQPVIVNGKKLTYKGKTSLRFVPAKPIDSPRTPIEPRRVTRHQKISVPLFSDFCEVKGCGKIATWMTSDEVEMEPEVRLGWRFRRARCVAVHFWCSWHYQPPGLFDHKGELVSRWEEAGGVRPQ